MTGCRVIGWARFRHQNDGRGSSGLLAGAADLVRRAEAILFRIKSERLELPAPFGWQIPETLNADAAGQATF
jgi:hypothetical protein